MPMKDTQNSNKLKCINFTKDKTKDKSLSFVNYIKRVV